ncbi:hypothetical protein KY289_008197 [Solanum tuberosum]|nr:hypothetical protein KY289_008197 [Solanum tuberosum]
MLVVHEMEDTHGSLLHLLRMGVPAHLNKDSECTIQEQHRFMPIANTIQECVSEFISFVTGEANEHCQRKTITAEDVLWVMSKLGFDDYIEPLTFYLHRYREFDGGERVTLRGEKRPMLDHLLPPIAHHHAGPPPMASQH